MLIRKRKVAMGGRARQLVLPGSDGNYASTPDTAQQTMTTDGIDIRWIGALTDWTPASAQCLIAKDDPGTERDYGLYVQADGTLIGVLGTNVGTQFPVSTVAPTVSNGDVLGVRMTATSAAGAIFYTSTDRGVTWTQLGTAVPLSAYAGFTATAQPIGVGANSVGTFPVIGSAQYAEVRNGVNGATVVVFNPPSTTRGRTTFIGPFGEIWTVNGTASLQ